MDDAERTLLSDLAREFYLEDLSKKEIADLHGFSRFKVARMLQQAREEGVVRIEIDDAAMGHRTVAHDLARHLRLEDCVVVSTAFEESENRRVLARAAASFIRARVREDDVVGLSWGRTLMTLGEYMAALPAATLVQLTGTVGTDFSKSPVEVMRRIAERASVRSMAIFAPLFVADARVAEVLRSEPANAATMREYERLDMAVLSIGSWDPPITQLADFFTDAERAEISAAGARAEMVGIFLADDGRIVKTSVDDRRISVSAGELLSARRVVAVAGTIEKVPAIGAVARSGLITALVTDTATAAALLSGPPVEGPVLQRSRPTP